MDAIELTHDSLRNLFKVQKLGHRARILLIAHQIKQQATQLDKPLALRIINAQLKGITFSDTNTERNIEKLLLQNLNLNGKLKLRHFRVVHTPLVFVRETPSSSSRKLGYKWRGEGVSVSTSEFIDSQEWLKLTDEDGWMLRNGSSIGLGELLREESRPVSQAENDDSKVSVSELLLRKVVESKYPKSTPRPEARLSTDKTSIDASTRLGLKKVTSAYDRARLPAHLRSWPETGPLGTIGFPTQVVELDAHSVSLKDFEASFVKMNLPCLLKGGAADWTPLRKWDSDYLKKTAGSSLVNVRVKPRVTAQARVFGDEGRMDAYEREEVCFRDLIDELDTQVEPRFYGARIPVADKLTGLLGDVLGGPVEKYGPAFGAQLKINPIAYIGGGRQATPLHFDPSENLLVVVQGSKELTLFHRADTERLYPAG